jgi:prepilin-type N-terminal cleavage/methylation domain-containing protein
MLYRRGSDQLTERGLTLPELLASIAIVGVISGVAVPKQLNQIEKAKQNEATATIAQIQTTIASYSDEFGTLPTSWKELNSTSAIMTTDGPAEQNNFEPITLAGGDYKAAVTSTDNKFTIVAIQPGTQNLDSDRCDNDFGTPENPEVGIPECADANFAKCVTEFVTNPNPEITYETCGRRPIVACLDLTNGASDIHKIKGVGQVLSPNCG